MNYTRNHHTNLKQFYAMFHVQNYILLSFQSFLQARQCCVNQVLLIQRPLNKIQGLLGKIQRLFKDLKKRFNFQGLFKGLMLFQGLFKTRANHVKTPKRQALKTKRPRKLRPQKNKYEKQILTHLNLIT